MTVTVFTPTYNRANTLKKLCYSLQNQSCFDFEWLVVDDGSTDETEQFFQQWKEQIHLFPISYVKVVNGGKHRAINAGVSLASGDLFFIVDSDDYLTPDAVQQVINWEKTIPAESKDRYAGVSGAKGYSNTQMIGKGSGKPYVDCTSQERLQYGISGDKAEVFYTHILKQFPFPAFENERFISESVVWFAIGRAGYKIRWYDAVIYIAEYRQDGLTYHQIQLFQQNPRGYLLMMQSDLSNLKLTQVKRLGYYAAYAQVAESIGTLPKKAAADLGVSIWTMKLACILKTIKRIVDKVLKK